MFLGKLSDRLLDALTFEYHPQEFYLSLQDPSIAQGIYPKFLQILIFKNKQTVPFDRIIPKILNTISKANLIKPGAYFSIAPFAN